MKHPWLSTILVAALAVAPCATHGETDAEVTAHRAILDLAGAFTNDGFKLRDSDITGILAPGKSTVIQVNLYAGNEYWFAVSTADNKSAVLINVYDEGGALQKTEPFASQADSSAKESANPDPDAVATNRAAAGFAPEASGPYYIKIANMSQTSATYCLVYSYK